MPRKDEAPAVRVYTVCDESRYLIVRNVPSLGCGEELANLFRTYGTVEECKPMDAEDCEPFTDVFWIKFQQVNSARFAKRKLDDYVFLGNQLQVHYAPEFESPSDTKEKLECRKNEVLARIRAGGVEGRAPSSASHQLESPSFSKQQDYSGSDCATHSDMFNHVSSDKDYFALPSMNQTVRVVREKLDKISSSSVHSQAGPELKKRRVDNRRRI